MRWRLPRITEASLSHDAFLGGRLLVWQPARGYRAGVDPVLLAAACTARAGDRVLDLGCGVGTAALCVGTRVGGLSLFGLERSEAMAALARRNAAQAELDLTVFEGDVAAAPASLRELSFDHVICNPPYFRRDSGSRGANAQREAAMGEDTPLAVWVDTARRRLKPNGWLTIIQRPERLPDLLSAMGGFGALALRPILPREGRDASLILLRARKGARTPMRILSPLVLHKGAAHISDEDDYAPTARDILRHAGPIDWDAGKLLGSPTV